MNYVALIIIEYIFSTSHNIPITFMKLEYTTFTYFIQCGSVEPFSKPKKRIKPTTCQSRLSKTDQAHHQRAT